MAAWRTGAGPPPIKSFERTPPHDWRDGEPFEPWLEALANRPIAGVRDLAALTIAVAVSCSLPMVLIERGNITIRVAAGILGATAGRLLDVFASLLVCGVFGLMAWQFQVFASKLALGNETTWVLRIPTAPFWYGVGVILWCAVAVQMIVAARDVARLVDPENATG